MLAVGRLITIDRTIESEVIIQSTFDNPFDYFGHEEERERERERSTHRNTVNKFLPREARRCVVRYCNENVFRPSVCPSVKLENCDHTQIEIVGIPNLFTRINRVILSLLGFLTSSENTKGNLVKCGGELRCGR